MITINKTKIQNNDIRIQLFEDELFIATKTIQFNVLADDVILHDYHTYFILQINVNYLFIFHQFNHQMYQLVFEDPIVDRSLILFSKDEYWAVRKWFLKIYKYEE